MVRLACERPDRRGRSLSPWDCTELARQLMAEGIEEVVLSVDEKTALQPRPRQPPTLPAPPQNRPNRHEHQYKRAGARKLFAAFDTRAGKV